LGLKVQPAAGDQISVGIAAVDSSLKIVQVSTNVIYSVLFCIISGTGSRNF
jgi:hypothetical protein